MGFVLVDLCAEFVDGCHDGLHPSGVMHKLASVIGKNIHHVAHSCQHQVLILRMLTVRRQNEAVQQAAKTVHARGVPPAHRYG